MTPDRIKAGFLLSPSEIEESIRLLIKYQTTEPDDHRRRRVTSLIDELTSIRFDTYVSTRDITPRGNA
jgi:hypothetical protein